MNYYAIGAIIVALASAAGLCWAIYISRRERRDHTRGSLERYDNE